MMFEDCREPLTDDDDWAYDDPTEGKAGIVEWFYRMGWWWVW